MTTTTDPHRAGTNGHGPPPVTSTAVSPPPVKLRRRPLLLVASIVAICVGALLGAWAWSVGRSTESVLAVRDSVQRGEVLTQGDIITVEVGVDPALHPLPKSQMASVIGQRASSDIAAGTLLTPGQLTEAVLPGSGMSLVGVALTGGGLPGEPLVSGDRVRVVSTPGQDGQVDSGAPPTEVAASVVSVAGLEDSGQTVVTVQVPQSQAAELAARAATGNVALVLDSRER